MDIERELRMALAARDPGPAFTDRVVARLDAGESPAGPGAAKRRRLLLPLALAASLLVAMGGFVTLHALRAQRQEQARQLQLALAITSERLNQMQQRLLRPFPTENGT